MERHDLRQLYYINLEIKKLQEDMDRLSSVSIVPVMSDMPRGGGTSDKVGKAAVEMVYVAQMLDLKIKELYIERARIEGFIAGIVDADVRLIFRLRHINCLSWEQIASEIGYSEGHVRKKYRWHWKDDRF